MKNNSQWKVVSVQSAGHSSYSVFNSTKKLSVAGTDKFVNAVPFFGGVAVAVEAKNKKDINIQWFIFNEDGILVKSCKTLRCVKEYINSTMEENLIEC